MKKFLQSLNVTLIIFVTLNHYSSGQVIYNYNGNTFGAPVYTDPHMAVDSLHYPYLNGLCPNAYSSYDFHDYITDDQGDFAFGQNNAISLTLNPQQGYQIKLSSIQISVSNSASGPGTYFLAFSYDNGASWLKSSDTYTGGTNCTTFGSFLWDFTDYTFNNQVLIRIYPIMASSPGGSFMVKTLVVNGVVQPSITLPQVNATAGDIWTCTGQSIYLTSNCSDTTAIPQWESGSNEENSFSPIPGGNVKDFLMPATSNGIRVRVKYTYNNGVTYGGLIRFITEEPPGIEAGSDTTVSALCGAASVMLHCVINPYSIDNQWWTSGDGSFNDATSSSPIYTAGPNDISNGFVRIFCSTFSIYGCLDGTDSLIVHFQSPVILQSPDTVYICQGQPTTLSSVTGYNSYLWNTGSTVSSIVVSIIGVYTVTVTLPQGCTASDSIKVINASNVPSTITANGPVTFCPGDSVLLSAATGFTYTWKKYGNVIPNVNSSTIVVKSKGVYRAVITSSQGCSKTTNKITTDVYPIPSNILTASGPLQICAGDSVVLHAETGTGYSYLWKKYGNIITGSNSSALTAKNTGRYKAIITNNYGCSRISQAKDVVVIFCPESNDQLSRVDQTDFAVYPNPVHDQHFTISISAKAEDVVIRMYDLEGKEVIYLNPSDRKSENIEVELHEIPNGLYLLQIQQGSTLQTKMLSIDN